MAKEESAVTALPQDQLSREDGSSWLSFILMSFTGELLKLGNTKTLEMEDLGTLSKQDNSHDLYARFVGHYAKEREKPLEKRSLWHVLWLTIGYWKLALALVLFALQAALLFGPVQILHRLVRSFQGEHELSTQQEWILVALLFIFPLVSSVMLAHSNNLMIHMGAQAKNTLIGVIYRKSLVISPSKRQSISTGRILTMFSDDTTQIRNFLSFANNAAIAPLQIGACLYLIYEKVGVATFAALGFSLVTVPLSGMVFAIVFKLRRQKMKFTDMRVKLMNEVLNGIRIIKYYSWEKAFVEMIESVRKDETALLERMGFVFTSAFAFIMIGAPQIQIVLVYLVYVSMGNQLDAATAFTALAYFGIMVGPFIFLPYGAQQYSQSRLAMSRILEFLEAEELEEYVSRDLLPAAEPGDAIIHMAGANLSWFPENEVKELVAKASGEKQDTEATIEEVPHTADDHNSGAYTIVARTEAEAGADNQTLGKDKDEEAQVAADSTEKRAGVSFADKVDVAAAATGEEEKEKEGESKDVNKAAETLRDITVSIRRGQLVGIVGTVGCGKSSLLSAILGEMYLLSGQVAVSPLGEGRNASMAYCDQRPWIINATVQDNILFGKEMDKERLDRAIAATCMSNDLDILPAGIDTEIGERGINMSGGQKARISLARAVYDDADIYLLDDPLSAVDAHVGEHLLSKCIKEELAGKTRLLVTHHLPALPQCDLLIILDDNGSILASGTYAEIISSGIDVEKYLVEADEDEEEENGEQAGADQEQKRLGDDDAGSGVDPNSSAGGKTLSVTNPSASAPSRSGDSRARTRTRSRTESGEGSRAGVTPGTAGSDHSSRAGGANSRGPTPRSGRGRSYSGQKEAADTSKAVDAGKHLMTMEERDDGIVKLDTILTYFMVGGVAIFACALFTMLLCHVAQIGANFWLIEWGNETTELNLEDKRDMSFKRAMYFFKFYAALQLASVCLGGIARMFLIRHRSNSSIRLHSQLLRRVLYYPVSFFDVTPIGRVINRFSQDMQVVDEDLASTTGQFIGVSSSVLGSVTAITASSKGTFLLLLAPLAYFYSIVQRYFQRANMAIARLDAVSRSPIYADFSQTLSGTSTVRAYSQASNFVSKLERLVNKNAIPAIMQQVTAQWLSIRLDAMGALTMFFMGALAVSSQKKDDEDSFIPAGYLALGLTYSIALTNMLKMMVRTISTMESQFNSVERFQHYIHMVPIEGEAGASGQNKDATAALEATSGTGDIEMGTSSSLLDQKKVGKPQVSPPASWPDKGVIEFRDVSMRYRDGPLVLKQVSFDVKPNDKIGICGRTGCGKSSLMVALFRIEELLSGSIFIDNIDISTISVSDLRRNLCIIPQDPVMFSASIRFNIDPFNQSSDEEIWEVLADVNMKAHVQSLPGGLTELVAEGGDNFSMGQRQLICIARAILRQPRILVMDEATASIDRETDILIQSMIRTKFQNCTVLTIAHRLHTIIDSNKILVMDKGVAAEYQAPAELLAKEGGIFAALWQQHVADGGAVLTQKSFRQKSDRLFSAEELKELEEAQRSESENEAK